MQNRAGSSPAGLVRYAYDRLSRQFPLEVSDFVRSHGGQTVAIKHLFDDAVAGQTHCGCVTG